MKKIRILLILSSIIAAPVHASNYVGISMGTGSVSVSGYSSASPMKIFYGMQMPNSPNMSLEVGMTNFGKFNVTGASNTYIDTTGFEVTARNTFGNGPVKGYAKFGLYSWSLDAVLFGSLVGQDSGSSFTYGFGGAYEMNNQLEVTAEYQLYSDVSGGDMTFIGVGVNYKF